jgi:uncharacterized protein
MSGDGLHRRGRARLVTATLVGVFLAHDAVAALQSVDSPYLRRFSSTPIHWQPWGTAAFERSRNERKPVFISLGDFATYEPPRVESEGMNQRALALWLNENVIAVKVDRHERPDVAALYKAMAAARGAMPVAALTNSEGVPTWTADRDPLSNEDVGRQLREAVAGYLPGSKRSTTSERALDTLPESRLPDEPRGAPLRTRLMELQSLTRDGAHVGIPALDLLLSDVAKAEYKEAPAVAARSLETLVRSPWHDALAGGFHGRPGSDRMGFEKLLCVNALLIRIFAAAHVATDDLLFRQIAEETIDWALRDLRDTGGSFWSSVGTGTTAREGEYYVWGNAEIDRSLGAERAREWWSTYELQPPGVFSLKGSPFAGVGGSRQVLLSRRNRRVRPPVDDTMLTGWNGLMIGALATSGRLLRRGSDVDAAARAAADLLDRFPDPATLMRCTRGGRSYQPALLEDYAYLIDGLTRLAAAAPHDARWPKAATALADAAVLRFADRSSGGFFETDGLDRGLPLRLKSTFDTHLPCAGATLALALVRLGELTGDARYDRIGRRAASAGHGLARGHDRTDGFRLARAETPPLPPIP